MKPTFSISRPFKIYSNWGFWFENRPSGKPGRAKKELKRKRRAWVKGVRDGTTIFCQSPGCQNVKIQNLDLIM
jgi:hypothetical protein